MHLPGSCLQTSILTEKYDSFFCYMDRNYFKQAPGLEISARPLAQASAEKCQANANHGALAALANTIFISRIYAKQLSCLYCSHANSLQCLLF